MTPTDERPIFFISHSSAGLPEGDRTVQVRDALAAVLEDRGWDVFLDREILQAGDRWRTHILYGLARASAAAILFNERAISQSIWVTSETQILCFHKSVDPLFQLVPVMFEGKTLQDTELAKHQPFELNQIQGFPDDPTKSPEALAAQIADRFDQQKGQIVRSRWCVRVATLLSNIKDRATLERVAGTLKLQIDARTRLSPSDLILDQLSNAIVAVLHHAEPLDIVDALSDVFLPLDDENRVQLKNHILAKWVPNESVEILMEATRGSQPRGILTIATMGEKPTRQYINRAKIEIRGGTVWAFSVSAATGDTDDSIVAQVESTIREHMVSGEFLDDSGNEMQLPQIIEREVMSSSTDVAICLLPPACSRGSALSRLVGDYPRILFIAQPAEDLTALQQLRTRPLRPAFTTDRNNRLSRLASRVDAALANVSLR